MMRVRRKWIYENKHLCEVSKKPSGPWGAKLISVTHHLEERGASKLEINLKSFHIISSECSMPSFRTVPLHRCLVQGLPPKVSARRRKAPRWASTEQKAESSAVPQQSWSRGVGVGKISMSQSCFDLADPYQAWYLTLT